MKVVILAGGLGTRLSEETSVRPKPMVEVGGMPILWHIMNIYAAHGLTDFIICLGYRGDYIKQYFANFCLNHSDVVFDLSENTMTLSSSRVPPWRISCVDTGQSSMTGGRLRRLQDHLNDTFCLTYGDGVADVDISASIDFHRQHGDLATLTAVQPSGRFGAISVTRETVVTGFHEKPKGDGSYVNGGFFVLEPSVIDYIADDSTSWENEPLERLSHEGNLHAWRHNGFWQCMDTLRDKQYLNDLWESGEAPWKTWKD